MKKIFSLLSFSILMLVLVSCTNNTTLETEEQQVNRLIKLSDKIQQEKLEQERLQKERLEKERIEKEKLERERLEQAKRAEENIKAIKEGNIDSQIAVDEKILDEEALKEESLKNEAVKEESKAWVDPHIGKTRGEIMVYEMEKISKELEVLESNVANQKENRAKLLEHKERLEKLDRMNKAGLK